MAFLLGRREKFTNFFQHPSLGREREHHFSDGLNKKVKIPLTVSAKKSTYCNQNIESPSLLQGNSEAP